MTRNIAFATLVLTFLLGCASGPLPKQREFKPMSLDATNEVYRVCMETIGVSCSMNPQLNRLTVTIDMTGSVEDTQRGVAFISTYYCRLSRLEGNPDNSVLLVRPDGSQVGRPCTLIGVTDTDG